MLCYMVDDPRFGPARESVQDFRRTSCAPLCAAPPAHMPLAQPLALAYTGGTRALMGGFWGSRSQASPQSYRTLEGLGRLPGGP
jgi:hypothetical protein